MSLPTKKFSAHLSFMPHLVPPLIADRMLENNICNSF